MKRLKIPSLLVLGALLGGCASAPEPQPRFLAGHASALAWPPDGGAIVAVHKRELLIAAANFGRGGGRPT